MKPIAYHVVKTLPLAPTVMSITLRPIYPTEALLYRPTQYMMVSIGQQPAFPCSIANSPNDSGKIEFHLRKWDAFLGVESIFLEGPLGGWHIKPNRPCLFLAGGTGISPVLSLMSHLPSNSVLYWGVKTAEDLYIQPKGIEFHPVISGWVHESVIKDIPDLSDWQVFASGPLEMVEKAYAAFTAQGLPSQYFFSDMRPFIK